MDYSKNAKYFKPVSPKAGIIVCVLGVIVLAAGSAAVGFIALLAGAGLLYLQFAGRPSDAELDSAAAKQLADVKARALRKLGLDEDEVKEIAPIMFDGYNYDHAKIKQGKDGKYRSNKYQAVVFFFSANEVHCYTYDFSLTENSQRESTDVYFYKDLVSVSTQTEGTSYSVGNGKSSEFDYEYFKLTTTGGTSISCNVRNADDAQRSINGMRSLIVAKKMG